MGERSLLSSVKRNTLEDQIYRSLREAILGGSFASGQRLVQEELAAELSASRIPVRAALKRLEVDGLVTVNQRGTYSVQSFGSADVEEIYSIRLLLEPHAAVAALPKITLQDTRQLQELLKQMEDAAGNEDLERYVELNHVYHLNIYRASGQPRLLRIIESLWSGRPLFNPLEISGRFDESIAEHEVIFKAIAGEDAPALSRAVSTHIVNARELLMRRFRDGAGSKESTPNHGP